ncbi:MAG: pyridoxal-phosphate dependent enzyme [Burkholderiales bacterium]|nr:pyridoxal-phosphate dependent enzyme [Burkholderiales bacterium]
MILLSQTSPLQAISNHLFPGIELWIKRDDLLHPSVSGNKFRKLKYLLQDLAPDTRLISMGGPWSNHLHALAHAAHLTGLPCSGLVRGLRNPAAALTPTLQDCAKLGMQLHFVSRDTYRQLRLQPQFWQTQIEVDPQHSLWIPEGGMSRDALRGVVELIDELSFLPDTLITACGTGTTLAGLAAGMRGHGRVLGISAVQNADFLSAQVSSLLQQAGYPAWNNIEIKTEFDHGGFGKVSPALRDFCLRFESDYHIKIEPVYTGKMLYAVHQLACSNFFQPGERVIVVHTGGLQGKRGYPEFTKQ